MLRTKTTLGVAFAVAFIAIGVFIYHVSYIDNSRYWGIPYHTTLDAAGLLTITEGQENMEEQLHALPDKIAKNIRDVKALQEQQKYLYNKLFNATVDLEKNSNLDMSLIWRIGPSANLYLKDLTKTDEAIYAIDAYEANLPQDSPLRTTMDEIRLSLRQEAKSKSEYVDKMNEWRAKEAEAEMKRAQKEAEREAARQEAEFQRLMNPPATPIEPPEPVRPIVVPPQRDYIIRPQPEKIITPEPVEPTYEEPTVEPVPEPEAEPVEEPVLEEARTSTDISGKDSDLLGLTHMLMADIQMTQVKMVNISKMIIQQYQMIDMFTAQLNLENTPLKVGAKLPVSYMFVRTRSEQILEVGQPLYECRAGIFFCRRVGTIKGTTGQKTTAPSLTADRKEEGFFIPIELTDPAAGRGKLLHIYEPPNS